MNKELNEFIHQTLFDFMNDKYETFNGQKWLQSKGFGHIVTVSVNQHHVVATVTADALRDDDYFIFEYVKETKQIFATGEYKHFAKDLENIFTLDCLGAL